MSSNKCMATSTTSAAPYALLPIDHPRDDDDTVTQDEGSAGSPGSQASSISSYGRQQSGGSEGTPECHPAQYHPSPLPKGFLEMVQQQEEQRKQDRIQERNHWLIGIHEESLRMVPGDLRLPALVGEAYRHEITTIRKHSDVLTEEQTAALITDTRRSYKVIFTEVKRACRSHPSPAAQQRQQSQGQPPLTLSQHRHNIANSGIQCFAAMLPYSNGLCGAVTDARRAFVSQRSGIPQHILADDGFHDLHTSFEGSGVSTYRAMPKGMGKGRTGRFIPISMSADHSKADRVSTVRRENLALHQSRLREEQADHASQACGRRYGGCGSPDQRQTRHVDPICSH